MYISDIAIIFTEKKMNPFYISGAIPDKYFCDRQEETANLTRILRNQGNVLLTSPRRMGKTRLINHVFEQPPIASDYYTFYVDIYPTTSLNELILYLSKEIYTTLVPKGKSILDHFLSLLHSLVGCFGYDPVRSIPTFEVKLGDIRTPELTLQEIFEYLENADKPCIVAIDEFQQIEKYPEKNVEALLRTHIQRMNNCQFIFAGSNRHVLENMFNSSARPFYNSVEQMYLDRIPRETYVEFILKCFREAGREIMPEAAELAYDIFDGHTYYVHQLMHTEFSNCDASHPVGTDDVRKALAEIIDEKSHTFSGQVNRLNYQQKEVLIAIAKEGKAARLMSVAFVRKHALKSPSSVQYAVSTLLDSQMITYEDEGRTKVYSVSDRFLEYWLKLKY